MFRLLVARGQQGATAWDFTHECRVMQYNVIIKQFRDDEHCVIDCVDEVDDRTGKTYGRFYYRGQVAPGEQARLFA